MRQIHTRPCPTIAARPDQAAIQTHDPTAIAARSGRDPAAIRADPATEPQAAGHFSIPLGNPYDSAWGRGGAPKRQRAVSINIAIPKPTQKQKTRLIR